MKPLKPKSTKRPHVRRKYLIWSNLVALLIAFISVWYAHQTDSKLGYSFSLFTGFVVLWLAIVATSLVVICLRLLKVADCRFSFGYTLLGILNAYSGCAGIYAMIASSVTKDGFAVLSLFVATLFLSGYMLSEAYGRRSEPIQGNGGIQDER